MHGQFFGGKPIHVSYAVKKDSKRPERHGTAAERLLAANNPARLQPPMFPGTSGGYGAIVHAMRHGGFWSAAACHSGDMAFELTYGCDIPATLNELAKHGRSITAFLAHFEKAQKPSDREVLRAMPRIARGIPFVYEEHRDNIQIVKERLVDKIDPPRFFPLVGLAQLHHCHWKCTITYLETIQSDYPFPVRLRKRRIEVVYIDKDHLHQYVGPDPETQRRITREYID